VALHDDRSQATLETATRCVVAAVGAHFGDTRADFDWRAMALRPAKGIHVVLRVKARDANVLMRSARDGRYLNTLPWHEHVLAGTTDTPASHDEIDEPRPTAEDVAYVLDAVRPLYPDADQRVRATWAGIRPLINAGAATTVGLSREEEIVSPEPGVFAVAGGKMTTYRAMARRTMDLVDRHVGRRRASEDVPLSDPLPTTGRRLVADAPFTRGELEAAARDGMVETLDDLLTQRLGITLVAPDAVREHAREWARIVAPILGWDETRVAREAEDVRERATRFAPP
jgi:glycerol-3-phosphate dehydrogenase